MRRFTISGGLKGLILVSASALLLSNASLAQEDPEDDGDADPQGAVGAALHEEGGALDALHEAEGGEAKAAAAQAIRDAMLAANEHANAGNRPDSAGRPDSVGRPDTPVRPDARPDFADRPVTPGRPDTPRRPGG